MKALREKLMSHLPTISGQRIRRLAAMILLADKTLAAYLFELTG